MYIQDKLKEYRDKLENEFLAHSMFSKDQLFINPRTLSAGNKTRLKNQIQSTYLLWLMVIVEAMERKPRFEFANTIENFLELNYHNVSVSEIESMIYDCFQHKGIFTCKDGEYNIGSTESCKLDNSILFSSGKLIGFDYYDAGYTSADGDFWRLGDIAEIIMMLCVSYNQLRKINSAEVLFKLVQVQTQGNLPSTLTTFTNRNAFDDYLSERPSIKSGRSHDYYLTSLETPEFNTLLGNHNLPNDIYQCDDTAKLIVVLNELVKNKNAVDVSAALNYRQQSCCSAFCYFLKHLLELNGVMI